MEEKETLSATMPSSSSSSTTTMLTTTRHHCTTTLQAMLLQEEKVYFCCSGNCSNDGSASGDSGMGHDNDGSDYSDYADSILQDKSTKQQVGAQLQTDDLIINRSFRKTMIHWAFSVIDFVHFHRETVEIAVSYFDRILQIESTTTTATTTTECNSTRDNNDSDSNNKINDNNNNILHNRAIFQITFITCLYLAIKMNEPTTISPELFAKLSQNVYTKVQIKKMETNILFTLNWFLNPPISMDFIHYFLYNKEVQTTSSPTAVSSPVSTVHPCCVSSSLWEVESDQEQLASLKNTLNDLAKVQMELILDDYRFVSIKRSTLAMAALLNALESLQLDQQQKQQQQQPQQLQKQKQTWDCKENDFLFQVQLQLHKQLQYLDMDLLAPTSYHPNNDKSNELSYAQSMLYQVIAGIPPSSIAALPSDSCYSSSLSLLLSSCRRRESEQVLERQQQQQQQEPMDDDAHQRRRHHPASFPPPSELFRRRHKHSPRSVSKFNIR